MHNKKNFITNIVILLYYLIDITTKKSICFKASIILNKYLNFKMAPYINDFQSTSNQAEEIIQGHTSSIEPKDRLIKYYELKLILEIVELVGAHKGLIQTVKKLIIYNLKNAKTPDDLVFPIQVIEKFDLWYYLKIEINVISYLNLCEFKNCKEIEYILDKLHSIPNVTDNHDLYNDYGQDQRIMTEADANRASYIVEEPKTF
jgi:hypothetical protein